MLQGRIWGEGHGPGPQPVGAPTRQIVPKQPIRRGRTYKNSTKNAPKLAILSSKNENFYWEGGPLQTPPPVIHCSNE